MKNEILKRDTYNVPGVDAEAAEKHFVAVGAPPLVPEAQRLVDVLELRPHAATGRPAGLKQRENATRCCAGPRVR